MAEGTPAAAHGKVNFGFLSQKVGPLPLWVWMATAIGTWYLVQKKGGSLLGSKTAPASTNASTPGGYGTDPAGNTGYIDPESGYVYGSVEDVAALQSQNALENAGGGTGSGTGPATYANNTAWASAAINYLVAQGVDPSQANEAIQQYLSGQVLTSQQQADVNLAIQALGAPPSLPGPIGTPPGQVVTPPGGTGTTGTTATSVQQYPPPTGLTAESKTATTVNLAWNDTPSGSSYPASYTVRTWPAAGGNAVSETTVSAPNDTGSKVRTVVQGLKTKTSYKIQVWANGGAVAPSGANLVVTTS